MCLRRFAQRVLAFCSRVCVCILQVFIPIYRGFERRWEFSRYINFALLEALILHHWSFAWFDNFPMKNQFQIHSTSEGTMFANITVILVLMCRHDAEMVVAEACVELAVVHFVHCTLSTLLSFWWSGFWWDASDNLASDDLASDDVSSGALSSDAFSQTHFFRRFRLQ